MSGDLDWERDGRDWPNRAASRFVRAGGLSWHVQQMGAGPVVLLVHGTAASTHSWRDFAPALARHFTVVAADLPGHGFTARPALRDLSLPGMAAALGQLVAALAIEPELVVGHSAGAAILCRLALEGGIRPGGIVSLNGALEGFGGLTGQIFSPLAKLLAWNPLTSHVVAATFSGRASVERLLRDTGSEIDRRGRDLYRRLVESPTHVGAALGMMANWDLAALEADLPRLDVPLLLVTGSRDRAIPPASAHRVKARVPGAQVEEQRGLGHLSHEERPEETAEIVTRFARSVGIAPAG